MHKTTELTMDGNPRTTVSHRMDPRIQGSHFPPIVGVWCLFVSYDPDRPVGSVCILLPPRSLSSTQSDISLEAAQHIYHSCLGDHISPCPPHSSVDSIYLLSSDSSYFEDELIASCVWHLPYLPLLHQGLTCPHPAPITSREPELFSVPLLKQQWTLLIGKVFINIHPPSHGFH